MMWMEFECEAWFVAEPPLARQHLFRVVCGCPKGLLDEENFGKLFLSFFLTVFCWEFNISEARIQAGWNVATHYRCASKVTILLLFRVCKWGVGITSSACLLPGASRLKSFGRLALFFFTNSFERAQFRRPISHKRREVYFTGDQLRSFKFPFARQHSRVASHIAD